MKKRASLIDPKKFETKLTLPLVSRMHTSSSKSKETSSPPKKASQAYLEPLKKYATIVVDSVDGESTPNSPFVYGKDKMGEVWDHLRHSERSARASGKVKTKATPRGTP